MNFSPRLTRAGLAFLVFGVVASTLPGTGNVLADAGGCPNANSRNRNRNRGLERAVEVAAAGAAVYYVLASREARDKEQTPKRNGPDPKFESLNRFTRPSDGPSAPGINH